MQNPGRYKEKHSWARGASTGADESLKVEEPGRRIHQSTDGALLVEGRLLIGLERGWGGIARV